METLTTGVSGRYKFVAHKPDGTSRDLTDWFDNLITNVGLDRMGVGGFADKCRVGTGSTAPVNSNTALEAQVGEADIHSATEGYDAATNLYGWRRVTYRFPAGTTTGNLSEVGVGWSGGALFSRALIKDGGGNPVTITVLADEMLDVVYELRMYRPTSDASVNIDISGTNYACTIRAANISVWRPTTAMQYGAGGVNNLVQGWGADAALDAITGQPTGTNNLGGVYAVADGAYVDGSYQRNMKVVVNAGDCATPLKGFVFVTAMGVFQMLTNNPIPKSASNKLTLNFRTAWARR